MEKINHGFPMAAVRSRSCAGILLTLFLMILSSCAAVGPDYTAPKIELSNEWHVKTDPALLRQGKQVQKWWTLFNDPMLNQFIDTAVTSNLDLKTAIARMEETRARLGVTGADRFPDVNAQGEVTRRRTSENSVGSGYTETVYSPGISASWEIDLFGRIRRSMEAATADFQASQEDRTDVMITLCSRVSLTYLDIRTTQARLASARANITSQKGLLELTRSRLKYGLVADLDVAQAERLLASAEAEVPPLRTALSQDINNLAVLLGQQPGSLNDMLAEPGPIPLPPTQATLGVPADLLRQRPDIRRAERELAAQTARIGVAKADLYPTFSLSGAFGYESISTSDLLDPNSRVLSFGPSLRWNIFSGHRTRSLIKAQDAVVRQYLLAYEQTVLSALSEVENTLKAYVEDRARLAAMERSVAAARRSVSLSTDLYKQGLSDFQSVLDAERAQFNLENQLALARGDSAANFARLYAALGGGWDPDHPVQVKNNNE